MSLEQRLEHLERKVQWMRRLGAVGVALVAAVFLMGQGKEKTLVVEAKAFLLKDAEGKKRAILTMMGKGKQAFPALIFQDGSERPRLQLNGGDGPGVVVRRLGTKMMLGADLQGAPHFVVTGEENQMWFTLMNQRGMAVVSTYDQDGKELWWSPTK